MTILLLLFFKHVNYLYLKVKRVEIIDVSERKDTCECQEEIERKDDGIITED